MSEIGIKDQCFGVEVEMTGITRRQAAEALAAYFGTSPQYLGTYYDTWGVTDPEGKVWKLMSDSSIKPEKKTAGGYISASGMDSGEYRVEMVTPKLTYAELLKFQECVRRVRKAGAKVNGSCGIHVHVDGKNHTPASLTRLMNFAIGRQDLFYEALEIGDRANRWCKKMNSTLLKAMQSDSEKTKSSIERIWYSAANDGYTGGINHEHYNTSRYHGVNLHAFFTKGTVEFRLFNGTTHAGKIKAYVQFCLAMSAWAIDCQDTRLYFKGCAGYTAEQKATLMTNVLVKRLGLGGAEFKTCRHHLTAPFRPQAQAEAEVA